MSSRSLRMGRMHYLDKSELDIFVAAEGMEDSQLGVLRLLCRII